MAKRRKRRLSQTRAAKNARRYRRAARTRKFVAKFNKRPSARTRDARQAKRLGLSYREYVRRRAARYRAHRKWIDSSSDDEILRTMIRTGQIY